jgi:hypothetical protein
MTTPLQRLRERAEQIAAEFEGQRAALFRADGQPKFGDAEHAERMRALEQERAERLDAVLAELREAVDEAEKEISIIEDGPLTGLLSSEEELERAARRRGFASDDVGSISEDALPRRLEAVLAGGDRPTIFAYFVAARGRADSILAGAEGDGSASARLPNELSDALDRMRIKLLGPEKAARLARARELTGEVVALELHVGNLQRGVRSAAEAARARRLGRLRSPSVT